MVSTNIEGNFEVVDCDTDPVLTNSKQMAINYSHNHQPITISKQSICDCYI